MDPREKKFRLKANELREIAPRRGYCYATDRITVDGEGVGYMYREEPEKKGYDSGWRFFSGSESQDYVDEPHNTAIYDVNTIANYSPDIAPLLDAPVGSAFERDRVSGDLVETDMPEDLE
jgi:hypothetical protein